MSGIILKTYNTSNSNNSSELINDNGNVVLSSTPFPSRPEFIRNGTFKSNMNGTEFIPASSGNQSEKYTIDGWFLRQLGGYDVNVARGISNGLGVPSQYYCVINIKNNGSDTGGKFVIFEQRVNDITKYAGKTISLGFYCKSSQKTSIFVQAVAKWDNNDNDISSGSIVEVGTDWDNHQVRISLPNYQSNNEVGINSRMVIRFWLCANGWENEIGIINKTSKYFYFANIEDGSKLTEPSRADEIDAVSKYFEKSSISIPVCNAGKSVNTRDLYGRVYFNVKKELSPQETQIKITTNNIDSPSVNNISRAGFNVIGIANSDTSASVVTSYTCNCEPRE